MNEPISMEMLLFIEFHNFFFFHFFHSGKTTTKNGKSNQTELRWV
jgi:hypothetical protein